jgi:hypothetical protein
MENYVIRIYRREAGDAITGVVEDSTSRRVAAFSSISELTDVLRRVPNAAARRRAVPLPERGDKSE